MVRAKFVLSDVTEVHYAHGVKSTKYRLTAQYDPSIPEDQRFAKATPSGEFWMQVDNPAAQEQLKPGQAYYIDLTPAGA